MLPVLEESVPSKVWYAKYVKSDVKTEAQKLAYTFRRSAADAL